MTRPNWYLAWPDRVEEVPAPTVDMPQSEYDRRIWARGPFPTREMAEEWRFRDSLESYWEHGLSVYANHCLGCGRFAKVLAFDDQGGGWAWRVTECEQCGVIDSRTVEGMRA